MKFSHSINCRDVGPGGTSVSFYATPEGVKAIWSNENFPDESDVKDEATQEARDGSNVSLVAWDKLESLLALKKKNKW